VQQVRLRNRLPDGTRDVLGMWIEQTEGAKFWLKVFNDLKTRGVHDILIAVAVVDGLKGLAEAIEVVFPTTTVQTCLVHLIRNSLDYASWNDRRAVAAALKPIYAAASAEAAQAALEAFETSPWGHKHPTRPVVAARLATRHPVLGVPTGSAPGDLYDQRHRESAHAAAQNHQDVWSFPERRGRAHANV